MSKQYSTDNIEIDPIAKEQLLLYPLEKLAPVKENFKKLHIGIPKENKVFEKRLGLRPEAVEILVRHGHQVIIESKAGEDSKFEDKEYSDAGASIAYSAKEVYESSDLILKIEFPTEEELDWIKPNTTLFSAVQIARLQPQLLKKMTKKRITALAFDFMRDKSGTMPVVRAMSEIAGSTVMLIAAEYLSSHEEGKGVILGGVTGVPPTKVVIVGAGTVGEYAARTALGLGAEVKVFDKNIYKLRRLKYAVGPSTYTSTIDNIVLSEAISRCDVLVTAMLAEQGRSPIIVTEEMVTSMKSNSVIIDVSIDQGGCVETSETTTLKKPIFKKHGVIHYCVPNIASRVARTSSTALSNIFTPYLLEIGERGGITEMMYFNKWFMEGIYTYKGSLTNSHIALKFGMPCKDLSLLMAARIS